MDPFTRSWAALRSAVAGLPADDFDQPSGCCGWLVRDPGCHHVLAESRKPDE